MRNARLKATHQCRRIMLIVNRGSNIKVDARTSSVGMAIFYFDV